MGLKAIRHITTKLRARIGSRQIREGRHDAGVVEELEAVAVHGAVAVRPAQRAEVDESVSRVLLRVLLRESLRGQRKTWHQDGEQRCCDYWQRCSRVHGSSC